MPVPSNFAVFLSNSRPPPDWQRPHSRDRAPGKVVVTMVAIPPSRVALCQRAERFFRLASLPGMRPDNQDARCYSLLRILPQFRHCHGRKLPDSIATVKAIGLFISAKDMLP